MMEAEMPLPTSEQLSKMSMEQLLGLWRTVREFRMKMMAAGPLPLSAIEEMSKIVPDQLMADIVRDNRKGVPAPSGLIPDEKREPAPVRGSGWSKPRPLEPPSGIRYVDQLCDVQDAIDKGDLARRIAGAIKGR
jgi:hypothetical protein